MDGLQPDVTIIGAGPAGSVAGVVLARLGWRVTIIEQQRFPRDKVCGECLSAVALEVLARHGLTASLERMRPARLRRAILVAHDGRSASLDLPREMWGVTRRAMDECLLAAAREAGATRRQPARCEAVEIADHARPRLRVRDLTTNDVAEVVASYVLVADGKAALGREPRPPATADLGVKAHFRGVAAPRDTIVLFGARRHYGGVAAVEGGLWNVAMNVPAARVRAHGGDLSRIFATVLSENAAAAQMFAGATCVGPWLASPLPRFGVTRGWPDRVIPVGNAAAALEPIGGEGMGLAMRSAELAADALDAAHRDGRAVDAIGLRRAYVRLWQARRVACRAGALVIGSAPLADLGIDVLSSSEPVARLALRLLGK